MIKLQDFQKQNSQNKKQLSPLMVFIIFVLCIFIICTKQKNIGHSYLLIDSVAVDKKEIDEIFIEKEIIKDSVVLIVEPIKKHIIKNKKTKEETEQVTQKTFQSFFNMEEDTLIITIE